MPRRPLSHRVSPIFLLLVAVTVGGGVLCTLDSRALITTGVVLLVLAGWAVSLSLHEFAHAYTAFRGGDTAVEHRGYLTLDLRRYTNPALTFVLPLLFLLAGGVPLPGGAVWINSWAVRSRPMRSMISLAGPLINLVLGMLLAIATRSVQMPVGLLVGLSYLGLVQLLAFVLNILPIPGLDGFGVLDPWLSAPAQRLAAQVRPWAPLAVLVLLFAVPGVSAVLFDLGSLLFAVLGGDPDAALVGHSQFIFWRH